MNQSDPPTPDSTGRRRFLQIGVGAAAGAAGIGLVASRARTAHADEPARTAAADGRSYVSGYFALDLDGTTAGFLQKADGGNITADVVSEPAQPNSFVKKHLGPIKYEDISMQIGFSMTRAVYDWIAASWQMNYQRKNGAIIAADYNLEAKSQREFFNALITETTIPACDTAAKDPAYLTLKIAPEYTRLNKASVKVSGDFGKAEQKLWLPSNFRLEIAGLDCTRVNKIEALTVKQKVAEDAVGDQRDYELEPASLEFPNLTITLPEVNAQTWYDWHEDFVIKGNNSEDKEKTGSLVFLSSNRDRELARVNFFNLGIFKLTDDKSEANADQIKRVSAEMYCERMEFQYTAGTIA